MQSSIVYESNLLRKKPHNMQLIPPEIIAVQLIQGLHEADDMAHQDASKL